MGEALNKRLFEKIQGIEAKRKKEQKLEQKVKKQGKKEPRKQTSTTDPSGSSDKRKQSLMDEEKEIHEAYQVLLTEFHKKKAKRRRDSTKSVKKQQDQLEGPEVVEDDFAKIRRRKSMPVGSMLND